MKVVCRVRPLDERELGMGSGQVHQIKDGKTVTIKDAKGEGSNNFQFDRAFDMDSQQG